MTTAAQRVYRNHKQRAARDGQRLDYTPDDLASLIQEALMRPCTYCRKLLVPGQESVDHRHPTSRSGKHSLANLVVCCTPCNQRKGDLTEQEFRELLQLLDHWPPVARLSVERRLRATPVFRRREP